MLRDISEIKITKFRDILKLKKLSDISELKSKAKGYLRAKLI